MSGAVGGSVPPPAGTAMPEIPGFVLLGELGRGSQACVYRVRRVAADPPDAREYAPKLMTVPLHEAGRAVVAFRRARRPCWPGSPIPPSPGSTRSGRAPATPTW
jgi:hypothetical protein